MNRNPYAPPTAAVADLLPPDAEPEVPFFAVSITKFVVMSICTFSIYEVYWFYKYWRRIMDRENLHIFPFTRAIFAVFFCYQCFSYVRNYQPPGRETQAPEAARSKLPAGLLASGWIVGSLLSLLPDPYWIISMLSFVFLIPVQVQADRFNAMTNPAFDRNARFSGWNWVAVILGGFFLLASLAGVFLLPEAVETADPF